MKTLFAFALFSLGFVTALAQQIGTLAGPITNSANNHVYYLLSEATWYQSRTQAVAMGGNLVTINDQSEQDWVSTNFGSFAGTNRSLWIGLSDERTEGTFVWATGESLTYRAWVAGEPNNFQNEDFVHMMKPGNRFGHPAGRWNDASEATLNDPDWGPYHGVVEIVGVPLSIRVSEMELCWDSTSNLLYQVQYRSEFTTNMWSDLGPPIRATGSRTCARDPLPVDQTRRFYQLVILP